MSGAAMAQSSSGMMSSGPQCNSTRPPTASGLAAGTCTVKVSPASTSETMLAR